MWNELLPQPFLVIGVVHVVVAVSTFEQDRNIKRTLVGMKPPSPPEKEAIYLKSRNGYLNSEMCVFNTLNLVYYYQYGR
jgi:hypothetical protein